MKTNVKYEREVTAARRCRLTAGATLAGVLLSVLPAQTALARPYEACCTTAGVCHYPPSGGACLYGGQGYLTLCWGIRACYMPDGSCIEVDGICCDDLGGSAGAEGEMCPTEQACCQANGTCTMDEPWNCTGTPGGEGSACEGLMACCDGETCDIVDGTCCAYDKNEGFTVCDDIGEINAGNLADGVDDACDNCPDVYNPDQDDYDQDGVGDACDNCDAIPNTDQSDQDYDQIGDVCDNCPYDFNDDQFDSDAYCSVSGQACGPFFDGYWPCPPGEECITETTYVYPESEYPGYGDACDNCPYQFNTDQSDSDAVCSISGAACGPTGGSAGQYLDCGPGDECLSDFLHPDTDYYAWGDFCDNCDSAHNSGQEDCDGDGVGDACDPDCNGNGVSDLCDILNGTSQDCNGNSIPDECEDDCDGDGIPDDCEPNCDGASGDTIPDDCDPDIDGDGVPNEDDVCDYTPLNGDIVIDPTSPFYGTIVSDLDGDCDVDNADYMIFASDLTGSGCKNGQNVRDDMCEVPEGCDTCCPPPPACNSCCQPCRPCVPQ